MTKAVREARSGTAICMVAALCTICNDSIIRPALAVGLICNKRPDDAGLLMAWPRRTLAAVAILGFYGVGFMLSAASPLRLTAFDLPSLQKLRKHYGSEQPRPIASSMLQRSLRKLRLIRFVES